MPMQIAERIRSHNRRTLLQFYRKHSAELLVFDDDLAPFLEGIPELGPVSGLQDFSLKERGASEMRLVCLVRPHISTVKHVNRMLKTMSSCRTRAVVVLGWIPRLSPALSQQLLSDRLIQVVEERVPLYWSPMYDDVLVMPATTRSYVDIHAKGSVYAVEQFYWGLEFLEAEVFGAYVPSIYALGSAGSSLCKVAMNVRRHYETLASISVADDSGAGHLEHRPLAPVHRTLKGTPWDVMPDAGLEDEDTGRIGFWGSRPCSFVDGCYLIDRKCDLVGLLSSPFTYGALLDFHLGFRSNYSVFVPGSVLKQECGTYLSLQGDTIFSEVGDCGLSNQIACLTQADAGRFLHNLAQDIQKLYDSRQGLKSIVEIRDFMKEFKSKQADHASLSLHVSLASLLAEKTSKNPLHRHTLELEDQLHAWTTPSKGFLKRISAILFNDFDECMVKTAETGFPHPAVNALRLLCLSSQVYGGLDAAVVEQATQLFGFYFGSRACLWLSQLVASGLLLTKSPETKAMDWQALRDALELMKPVAGKAPLDFVHHGMSPLSVRLVEELLKPTSASSPFRQVLDSNMLSVELKQQSIRSSASKAEGLLEDGVTEEMVIVGFLGGVTFGEVAAIRALSKHIGKRILVLTNELVSATGSVTHGMETD